jgi:hypothetical protein
MRPNRRFTGKKVLRMEKLVTIQRNGIQMGTFEAPAPLAIIQGPLSIQAVVKLLLLKVMSYGVQIYFATSVQPNS